MSITVIIVAGIIATLLTDLWQLALGRAFKLPVSDWAAVGRWVGGFPRGQFVAQAGDPTHIRFERLIGWTFHYAVGIAYAAIFALVCAQAFAAGDAALFACALAFGALTLVAPWLIMQPAMGRGVFASRAGPHRRRVLIANAATHLGFGVGLYVGFASAAKLT